MWILPRPLQLRHRFPKASGTDEVLAQLEPKLKIGRISGDAFSRIGNKDFRALRFGSL